jgi:hypothetical protein
VARFYYTVELKTTAKISMHATANFSSDKELTKEEVESEALVDLKKQDFPWIYGNIIETNKEITDTTLKRLAIDYTL